MWRRRRRKKGKLLMGCLVLLLIGFAYGYITNDIKVPEKIGNQNKDKPNIGEITVKLPNNKKPKESNENVEKKNTIEDRIPIVVNENVATDDTQIVFNTYYKKTSDVVKKESKIPSELVGRNLDELRVYFNEKYRNWDVRECNKDKVELYQVTDQIPPNFYIAKEHNGCIAIFQVNDKGEYILIEETQIPTTSLSSMDLQYVKNGIVKKNRDEINQILEDYSS
ncbi:BofC C-terminal domain-containing protein [Crassaminicella profunda]|uniref:BofC C-terminal domain-containing protein n=1 Tax=Crassaminicella profunda TaxID=1286698 RepID=UPI001CA70ADC|nr:BofC C-terminal domain-containing protein [Crassaminicella profunda]QZY57060.1 BofC C-terminal domain-containing protein [Crassaminicella profunda]